MTISLTKEKSTFQSVTSYSRILPNLKKNSSPYSNSSCRESRSAVQTTEAEEVEMAGAVDEVALIVGSPKKRKRKR